MENKIFEDSANPMDSVSGKGASATYATENPKNKDQKKTATKKTLDRKQSVFMQVLNGEILAKDFVVDNLVFVFFCVFLLILNVSKGYYGKQLQTEMNAMQNQVDGANAEYVESKARLEESTQRYRLVKKLNGLGVKESVSPVKVIRIKKENE